MSLRTRSKVVFLLLTSAKFLQCITLFRPRIPPSFLFTRHKAEAWHQVTNIVSILHQLMVAGKRGFVGCAPASETVVHNQPVPCVYKYDMKCASCSDFFSDRTWESAQGIQLTPRKAKTTLFVTRSLTLLGPFFTGVFATDQRQRFTWYCQWGSWFRQIHRPHTGAFRVHYFIFWVRGTGGFWLCDIAIA